MADEIKKIPRKLRGRETIMVDEQILRWRERMRKENRVLGRHSKKQLKKNAYDREYKQTSSDEKLLKKKDWF